VRTATYGSEKKMNGEKEWDGRMDRKGEGDVLALLPNRLGVAGHLRRLRPGNLLGLLRCGRRQKPYK